MKPEVIHTESFARDAADYIVTAARKAIEAKGTFRLALSGGNTPRQVFSELARRPGSVQWDRVLFTFGDERCVPPAHEQSNFRMANESLFVPASVPGSSILRIRGELPPTQAAADYDAELTRRTSPDEGPRFVHDLILLGLGDDGHTASLFPGTKALEETERSVVENHVPKLNADRVTFTFPLINAAREVCFLVGDASKRAVVDEVLEGVGSHPASRVRPRFGRLTWILGYL